MIIFFYGENTYKIRQKIKELKNKFINEIDKSACSIINIDGKSVVMQEINEKISPQSLLASKRMIIIENLFLNKNKDILDEVYGFFSQNKSYQENNIIIFNEPSLKTKKIGMKKIAQIDAGDNERNLNKKEVKLYQFLTEQKFQQEFKNLSNTEAAEWLRKEAEALGAAVSNKTAQALVGLAGNDLWRLDGELKKLFSYKSGLADDDKVEIKEEDIAEMVIGNFDENIFQLTDAIASNNKSRALQLIEDQLGGGLNENYLLTMVIRQFKILLQIKLELAAGKGERKISSDLGLHPFVVQKGVAQAKNFDLEKIKTAINQLIKIDYLMKTGQADIKTMINLLILKI
jgi:DNA polymerase III subunit delta